MGASTRITIIGLVELKPCRLYQLTGINQKELSNLRIDLGAADKYLNTSLCNIIEQAINVNDISASKAFYANVLEQKIIFDMGEHITFEGGFSIQQNYSQLIGLSKNDIL